ncbi:MAG: succinate dehydrogenase assembly factor 2 [Methylomonas sp.]|nr:succinate dehydrogenase assembly factor 2 [Methylomonas sp.]
MSDLNKLRWRCRRGTVELDLLLSRYLDQCYARSEPEQKRAFVQLLELEDGQLLAYLLGESRCQDTKLVPLIAQIKVLPVV